MAGYKQSLLDLSPKLLMTFDGDLADLGTGELLDNPTRIILDESGEDNYGTMIVDHDTQFSYKLARPSMVDLEINQNYSLCVGASVPLPLHPSLWAKNFVQVPHSNSFSFPNNGSYSFSFLFKREVRETAFRTWEGNPQRNYTRAFIRKGLLLQIDTYDQYNMNGVQLNFTYLIGSNNTTRRSFEYYMNETTMKMNNNFVVTWDVKAGNSALFTGVLKIYHNGKLIHTDTQNYFDTYPTTNISSPWEFGGSDIGGGTSFLDRQVTPTYLDQIAVFQRALSEDEVVNLFKKTRTYKDLAITQGAEHFWALDDEDVANLTSARDYVSGGVDGVYYGISQQKVFRNNPGPERIPSAHAPIFVNGGAVTVKTSTQLAAQTTPFDPTGNFTIDGWFYTSQTNRGTIISMTSSVPPFAGYSLHVNQRDEQESFGYVQLTLNEDTRINSLPLKEDGTPNYFNDGKWHYFAIRRTGIQTELWLDGIKQGESVSLGAYSVGTSCRGIFMMATPPSDLSVNGALCYISATPLALSDSNIRARYSYGLTWRIRGTITLQGVPYGAVVRAHNHKTGLLVTQVTSDPGNGGYILRLFDNSLIDVTVFSENDPNVRFRLYGPISPTLQDDQVQ